MIKPNLSCEEVSELIRRLYGFKVTGQHELASYDDVNIHVKVADQSENEYIPSVCPAGYVLKILNSEDSQKVAFVDAMHEAIKCASEKGIITSFPVQNRHGSLHTLENIAGTDHLVRLFQYVPGELLLGKSYTSEMCFQVGQLAALLDEALMDVSHPALDGHKRHWSLTEVSNLADKMAAVKDPDDRALIQEVVNAFSNAVVSKYDRLTKGVIHADFNEGNILVRKGETSLPSSPTSSSPEPAYTIHGILDFGDLVREFVVFEAAIAIMYTAIESKVVDPIDAGGHVLAGFLSNFPLSSDDVDVLKVCVCGRFAQSLVYGAYEHLKDSSNTYCLHTSKVGWSVLRQMWRTPKDELYLRWRDICAQYGLTSELLDLLSSK